MERDVPRRESETAPRLSVIGLQQIKNQCAERAVMAEVDEPVPPVPCIHDELSQLVLVALKACLRPLIRAEINGNCYGCQQESLGQRDHDCLCPRRLDDVVLDHVDRIGFFVSEKKALAALADQLFTCPHIPSFQAVEFLAANSPISDWTCRSPSRRIQLIRSLVYGGLS